MQIIHTNDHPLMQRAIGQMLSAGWADCECRGVRKDGQALDIHIVLRKGAKGSPRGHYCFVNDISHRKQLQKQAAELGMQEQRRIAKQLHDHLGQQLPVINMLAAGLQRELTARKRPEAARAKRLVDGVREAQMQLRELLRGLMPAQVDTVGLVRALEGLVERFRDSPGAAFCFECEDEFAVKNDFIASNLYHIAQESLDYVARHPGEKSVTLSLHARDGAIGLHISDSGGGLHALKDGADENRLRMLVYRAGLIGAHLNFESNPGEKATLTCTLEEDFRHASKI
jgi:signal transduction histidine kinase